MKDHVILEDRCRHGHLTAGLMMRLKCSVSNYIAKNEWFYIGITNRPYRRSIEHEWRNHERMILLYRTTSESYVRSLERDLLICIEPILSTTKRWLMHRWWRWRLWGRHALFVHIVIGSETGNNLH